MQIIQRMGKVPVLVIDGILNIIFYLINCINKEVLLGHCLYWIP